MSKPSVATFLRNVPMPVTRLTNERDCLVAHLRPNCPHSSRYAQTIKNSGHPETNQGGAQTPPRRKLEIDTSELTYLGSGWEFDVFLTADGWVFRFLRREAGAALSC